MKNWLSLRKLVSPWAVKKWHGYDYDYDYYHLLLITNYICHYLFSGYFPRSPMVSICIQLFLWIFILRWGGCKWHALVNKNEKYSSPKLSLLPGKIIISYIAEPLWIIGHFRVTLWLCYKTVLSAKPFMWKWVWLASEWTCGGNSLSREWFRTMTRFDTEVKSNSEIAYCSSWHLLDCFFSREAQRLD